VERERGAKIFIQHCFICRPSDQISPCRIKPSTVATLALTVRRSADHSAKSQPHSARSQPFFLCFSTSIQYHMHTVSPAVETSISSSLWRSPKRSLWGAGPEPVFVNLLRSPEIDSWALKRLQIRAQDSIP
jgi:hypothetical protein